MRENVKMFCFPYAGASAMFYNKWKSYLDDDLIRVCPVELAGRGRRYSEPFYQNMTELIEDLYNEVIRQINGEFIFFGHSLGGLLAYQLALEMWNLKGMKPLHIFVSGRNPPHVQEKRDLHLLPDDEFKKEVYKYGGISTELLDDEVMNSFLPILRADFRVLETFEWHQVQKKLNCNITVLGGDRDFEVCEADLTGWGNYTEKKNKIIMFQGDHFFIFHYAREIMNLIHTTTMQELKILTNW